MNIKPRYAKYLGFVFGIVLINVLIDYLAKKLLSDELTFWIFKIGQYKNLYGLFGWMGLKGIVFVSLFVIVLLVFSFLMTKNEGERMAILLIFSGGIFNFAERVIFGYVKDYVAVESFGYFNFADVIIGLGVVILLWKTFIRERAADLE